MKLIYKIIRVNHLTDGRVIEQTIGEVKSEETQEVRAKAHEKYEEKFVDLASHYLPNSPYEYEPSQGIGFALNLEAIWDTDTGEGGHKKTYIIRTSYRRSKGLDELMALKEEDLLEELANPKYPVNRFWFDGNSSIGYCDWYDKLHGFYQINLFTMTHFGLADSEVLYNVGHRHLGEARKIALSFFNQEVEKFSIKDDIEPISYEEEFYVIVLQLRNHRGQCLTVEAKPQGVIVTEDQEEEKKLFRCENLIYNRKDDSPSTVNEIEDLWSADHLTTYDYEVMDPYKKYDLIRYVYNLWGVINQGGRKTIRPLEAYTHHDLLTAQQAALDAYEKEMQSLDGDYSPDVLNTADATVISYNFYLELSEVGSDFKIITEASFSYDGTPITQKDEEKKIFEDLRRENPSSTFVNNRQKKDEPNEEKSNKKNDTNHPIKENLIDDEKGQNEDDDYDDLPW